MIYTCKKIGVMTSFLTFADILSFDVILIGLANIL